MRIGLKDVEENIKPLGGRLSYDKDFIFELLAAYGRSPANITRLKNGQLNVADDKEDEVAQKNVVYFKPATGELYTIIDDLQSSPTVVRYSTRFVVVTDYQQLLAIDTKTGETLDINIRDISRYYAFFLPWAGMEKAQFITENHADVKAAEKMAKLFDILIEYNGYKTAQEWHYLTTFFTRLLFCYFAEDTNIFKKNQFVNALASYTKEDGSDMRMFLTVLFESLDEDDKDSLPAHIADFPYVNGQLFSGISEIPNFNKEARNILIESASQLDWSEINPDIFGSMFQAVVRPSERTGLGQHYTSVPNIMRTIEPLFLNQLKDEFNKYYDDISKLDALLARISQIKVFDPACGSGNFLIIAYKELRRLEHAILERQGELRPHQTILLGSRINIENFYGIEIDDFAHEVAILSLWLAKHQMNLEFSEKFGIDLPLIPLKEAGNIKQGNSAREDWDAVCRNIPGQELYLIGNPPYLGSRNQKAEHKADKDRSISDIKNYKVLDYVAIWLWKGSQYLLKNDRSKLAFVMTNSIVQGDHIANLWPEVLGDKLEIDFAYTSFKWANNAKKAAGVTVVIVALQSIDPKSDKYIFDGGLALKTDHINAYLAASKDVYIGRRSKPLSTLPIMSYGNYTGGCEPLMLSPQEKRELIDKHPETEPLIRRLVGSEELNKGTERYCIWIEDKDLGLAMSVPEIAKRIDQVRINREKSEDPALNKLAARPHQFRDTKTAKKQSLVVPIVFSERRPYIPIDFLPAETIIPNSAQAIYDPETYVFGIISSKMHILWVKTVAGKMKTDFRYSNVIAYNNFPLPVLTSAEKEAIEEKVMMILDVREQYPEKTLAEMYKTDHMPEDLLQAHVELDGVLEKAYRTKPFESDEERLAHLFDLYEIMTAKEKETA